MKIGFLSICAMMFLLYGTDCRADAQGETVKPDETMVSQQKYRVFSKSKKSAIRNEKRRASKKSKQDVSNSQESDEEEFYDAVDPEYNAWLEKKKLDERNSAESEANKSPWYRDSRSFADVVKGVKKEDVSDSEDDKTVVSGSEENLDEEAIEEPKKNPWFRDKRTFAQVVSGVKKEEVDDSNDDKTVVGDEDYQQEIEKNVTQSSKKAKNKLKSTGKYQAKIESGKKKYEERRAREEKNGKSAWKNFK